MSRYLYVFIAVFLYACNAPEPKESKEPAADSVSFEGTVFYPAYMGDLTEIPVAFGPVWDLDACKELKVKKITMFARGSNVPRNIAEKYVYTFSNRYLPQDFYHYLYTTSSSPSSTTNFVYNGSDQLIRIDIPQFMGAPALPPVLVNADSSRVLVRTPKADQKSDSLIFFPDFRNPKVICNRVGGVISAVEIFAKKESNSQQIKDILMEIDTSLVDFQYAEIMVTHMENGLPQESYALDENWRRTERSRSWTYNRFNQPVQFRQWLHGNLVKDISVSYGDNHLPEEITVNRKKLLVLIQTD